MITSGCLMKNIQVFSVVLHDLVLNLRCLVRQQFQTADVRRIRKLITVIANLGCDDNTAPYISWLFRCVQSQNTTHVTVMEKNYTSSFLKIIHTLSTEWLYMLFFYSYKIFSTSTMPAVNWKKHQSCLHITPTRSHWKFS